MRDGFGFLIVFGILFIGWLMFSSKANKEAFLGYAWAAMITVGSVHLVYMWAT